MGLENKIKYKCDLCGFSRTRKSNEAPKDWVIIEIPDSHVDRTWHKKCICEYCVKLIKFEIKRNESNS